MKKRKGNYKKRIEDKWNPKENMEYNFPRSVRYCYTCELKTIWQFSKDFHHSTCLKCGLPGVNQVERKMLNLKKK